MNSASSIIDREDCESIQNFLIAHQLATPDETVELHRLSGGVSSDIWRVDLDARSICVKRALEKLRVDADWHAPVDRNAYEWAWLDFAAKRCPDNVPQPLAHDLEAGLFAMSFLEPKLYPVWKQQLLGGQVDASTASQVGAVLGSLHAASALDATVERAFDSTENFFQLRLEPYLISAANRNRRVATILHELVDRTRKTRFALVHGDVSPKNILVGPKGPVFLDAECAWYGDPAFDVAFCLNHLLLKSIPASGNRDLLSKSYENLVDIYLSYVSWEEASALEQRASTLLPALLLARIDGKSPVEYIEDDVSRTFVRDFAISALENPQKRLSDVASLWSQALESRG